MKIQTFSIVVGGRKCNASCPFCVSKLTGKKCVDEDTTINERNFKKACEFAKQSGVNTIILTGKGEPLLYCHLITKYLELLEPYNFPFIELQTNGIELTKCKEYKDMSILKQWYNLGLTTVSLSCVHWYKSESLDIYGGSYEGVSEYSKILHDYGFMVRASCIMLSNKVNDIESIKIFAKKCKEWGIEQLTVRSVTNISFEEANKQSDERQSKLRVYDWIEGRTISMEAMQKIVRYFDYHGSLLLELAHGAKVYDYEGQNLSISNCLTHSANPDDIRQLIFFSDGRLKYSWSSEGAILL